MKFYSKQYGKVFEKIYDCDYLPSIGTGEPIQEQFQTLAKLASADLFAGQKISNNDSARCCLAGIWLHLNFLDESHKISQSIKINSGSYWHGIMHRREGDFWNSKYWFRQVGLHPIFAALLKNARELVRSSDDPQLAFIQKIDNWDPFRFVDLCQRATAGPKELTESCREIQLVEWQLLFDYCYHQAVN